MAAPTYPFAYLSERGVKRAFHATTRITLADYEDERVEDIASMVIRRRTPVRRKAAKRKARHYHRPRRKAKQVKVIPALWNRVVEELHILVCTKDKRYAALRRQFGKEGRATQVTVLTAISTSIGAEIGTTATTVVMAIVSLGFLTLLKVGKEAFCKGKISDARV